ncbi:MAG: hypothetical protein ABEJ99_05740, partial [Candidatus Nanohaloarchaea archaeon]
MNINSTQKMALIAILTIAILTPAAANAAPTLNYVTVSPSTVTEGSSVTVSLQAGSHNEADLISAQARLDS